MRKSTKKIEKLTLYGIEEDGVHFTRLNAFDLVEKINEIIEVINNENSNH